MFCRLRAPRKKGPPPTAVHGVVIFALAIFAVAVASIAVSERVTGRWRVNSTGSGCSQTRLGLADTGDTLQLVGVASGYRKRRHKLQVVKETPESAMRSNHGKLQQQLHNDYTNIML